MHIVLGVIYYLLFSMALISTYCIPGALFLGSLIISTCIKYPWIIILALFTSSDKQQKNLIPCMKCFYLCSFRPLSSSLSTVGK